MKFEIYVNDPNCRLDSITTIRVDEFKALLSSYRNVTVIPLEIDGIPLPGGLKAEDFYVPVHAINNLEYELLE